MDHKFIRIGIGVVFIVATICAFVQGRSTDALLDMLTAFVLIFTVLAPGVTHKIIEEMEHATGVLVAGWRERKMDLERRDLAVIYCKHEKSGEFYNTTIDFRFENKWYCDINSSSRHKNQGIAYCLRQLADELEKGEE